VRFDESEQMFGMQASVLAKTVPKYENLDTSQQIDVINKTVAQMAQALKQYRRQLKDTIKMAEDNVTVAHRRAKATTEAFMGVSETVAHKLAALL
jgi:hypothetical protein